MEWNTETLRVADINTQTNTQFKYYHKPICKYTIQVKYTKSTNTSAKTSTKTSTNHVFEYAIEYAFEYAFEYMYEYIFEYLFEYAYEHDKTSSLPQPPALPAQRPACSEEGKRSSSPSCGQNE